jgi:hypothetical protein
MVGQRRMRRLTRINTGRTGIGADGRDRAVQ